MGIYKNGKLIAGGSQALPLLTFMWADHQLNDVSWLRADTFSWHTGNPTTGVYKAAYAHLSADITGKTLQSETVSGITVQFYLADDGHKICPASEESNVSAIYNATGVAWYYIIDTTNQRFKLPREKDDNKHHGKVIKTYKDGVRWARLYADGWVEQGGQTGNGTFLVTMADTDYSAIVSNFNQWAGNQSIGGAVNRTSVNNVTFSWGSASSSTLSWEVKGWSIYAANASSYYNGKKYLYFYVGQFTQTALENTAGLNTEMFNDLNAHKVIEFQEPTSTNGYTWYRKYADGWVEQGGVLTQSGNSSFSATITFPIVMIDNNYNISFAGRGSNNTAAGNYAGIQYTNESTTGVGVYVGNDNTTFTKLCWQVSGMAA